MELIFPGYMWSIFDKILVTVWFARLPAASLLWYESCVAPVVPYSAEILVGNLGIDGNFKDIFHRFLMLETYPTIIRSLFVIICWL